LKARALNAKQRKRWDSKKGGLRVLGVRNRPAKDAGVQARDILKMINNKKNFAIGQFKVTTESLARDKFISMLVQRQAGPEFLALRIPG